ncbi:uncharacterized protein H6S33_011607 [Morchella sextelata]|uniref:uncharacterized protein n=1 Tax=Morchella sextelata TaxID=1174677 RepID=UPI001D05650B|nr:uncharacterized protein H6S33_011607 [Morchella sextelata]KAH0611180.1 hypothetical protein H6S33_011607 [Morchella sextelata]
MKPALPGLLPNGAREGSWIGSIGAYKNLVPLSSPSRRHTALETPFRDAGPRSDEQEKSGEYCSEQGFISREKYVDHFRHPVRFW